MELSAVTSSVQNYESAFYCGRKEYSWFTIFALNRSDFADNAIKSSWAISHVRMAL
jgi:hypothetical protein